MTQDEVATILCWQRATEADVTERNVTNGLRHHQTADSMPCSLWVRSDRRSFPMDWAYFRDDLTPEQMAEQMRYLNDMIVKNETSVEVADQQRTFYRGLLDDKHDAMMELASRRRWSFR